MAAAWRRWPPPNDTPCAGVDLRTLTFVIDVDMELAVGASRPWCYGIAGDGRSPVRLTANV
jgi:hypothetical protein